MIQVENITKRFGKNIALDGITLTVNNGEILGFLGPNGAGKSTAMNIITGYISTTEGSVKVDGIDILENPQAVKKKIGYLPELPPLYMDMTVDEYLLFVSRIKGVPKSNEMQDINRIMKIVKIVEMRSRLIKNLSKGYKQRVGIAQAMIGNPEVLILDEPTVGLDPQQIIEIRSLIKDLGKTHTIILSSHILSEVSAVCDRVVIINKGKIVASGTPDELSKKLNYSNKILVRIKGPSNKVMNTFKGITNIVSVKDNGVIEANTVDIIAEGKKDIDVRELIFNTFSKTDMPILIMKPMDLTLEDVFLQVTSEKKEVIKDVSNI